ncbi:DENN domain-containing protein 4C-like [Paramacrobiotus metropolitanus]|uniref:DENN domain-containing protein 4C-like n=1 Tax=Paramacrobiotus metropolitanus TaxID=2943436 RepID=UPI0024456077|nr:DENN domain-containing protein 4C-like [Paramacrobiotus metropolitanus]
MEDQRVADYFIVAGLDEKADLLKISDEAEGDTKENIRDPITDLAIINRSDHETVPDGYFCVELTPSGVTADLNYGSFRCPELFLCYRRGRDKPPLVHIGVIFEGRDKVLPQCEVIRETPEGRCANVNNTTSHRTFITFKRASPRSNPNDLVVTEVCVVIKDEKPPHTFWKISDRNLNNALFGSDVFLCYKKATGNRNFLTYQPALLFRYPQRNHASMALPDDVQSFSMPMGASLEAWPREAESPRPIFAKFVLTVSGNRNQVYGGGKLVQKLYGAALTFYESYPRDKLTAEQKRDLLKTLRDEESNFFVNKSICILSKWPFFDVFQSVLHHLLTMCFSTSAHSVPIERVISHFIQEVPFPSAYRPKVQVQLTSSSSTPVITLTRPGDSPIPLNGASFSTMVKNLSPENCALILLVSLLEQKICLHSLRPDVLTAVAESVTTIIFPFVWQCSYVPLCPLKLCALLQAPVPFVYGVDSRYFELCDPPPDVIYVDLDTNSIEIPKEKFEFNLKMMPKKPMKALMEKLEKINLKMAKDAAKNLMERKKASPAAAMPGEKEFKQKIRTRQFDMEIQEAFLSFMVSILKGYRSFLKPMVRAPAEGATDPGALFDIAGFLKSRDRSYAKFYDSLIHTQQFIRFIEERSIMSDREASYGMAFFDECVQRVEKEGTLEISLLDTDEMVNERTVFIPPPENEKSTEKFVYGKGFPPLRYELFGNAPSESGLQTPELGERESKPTGTSNDLVTMRTKQEVKTFQSYAQMANQHTKRWAKCLLSTGYALWFMYLPSLVASSNSPSRTLRNAFETLKRMLHAKIQPSDEVAYRIMMQLCGKYSQPALAVKVLSEMKNYKIQPDAVTYGFYNKVVFESTWPSASHSPYMLWMKTKHVIRGVTLFREAGAQRRQNRLKSDEIDAARTQLIADNASDEGKGTRGSSDTGFFSLDQDTKRNSMMSLTSGEFMAAIAELKPNEPALDESSADITLDTSATLVPDSSPTKSSEVPEAVPFDMFPFESNCIVRKSAGSAGKSRIPSIGSARAVQNENDTEFNSAGLLMVHRSRRHTAEKTTSNSWRPKHRRHRSWTEGTRHSVSASKRKHLSTSGLALSPQHLKRSLLSRKSSKSESTVPMQTPQQRAVSPLNKMHLSSETVVVLEETVRTVEIPSPTLDFPPEDDEITFGFNRRNKSMSVPRDSDGSDSVSRLPGSSSIEFASTTLPKLGAFIRNSKSYSSIKKFWNTGDRKKSRDGDMGMESVETSPLVKGSAALVSGMKSMTLALGKKIGELSTTLTTASSETGSPSRIGSSLRDLPGALNFTDYGFDSFGPMTSSQDWEEEEEEVSGRDDVDAGLSSSKSWEFPAYHFSPRHAYRLDGTVHGIDGHVLVHVDMCSVVACHKCETAVYDEEVLAGFYPDESNLNARCPYCATKFLPVLTIVVHDHIEVEEEKDEDPNADGYDNNCPLLKLSSKSTNASVSTTDKRSSSLFSSQDNISAHNASINTDSESTETGVVPVVDTLRIEETLSVNSGQGVPSEDISQSNSICGRSNRCKLRQAITVPYLSPLVMRKELETLMANEGDTCLLDPDFVKSHDIIYWNLLWYCERMNLPQSLSGMLLDANGLRLLSQLGHSVTLTSRSRYVLVSCRWDNPELHPQLGVPMYISYTEEGSISSQLNALGIEDTGLSFCRNLMDQMLARIRDESDLESPMRLFLHELQKRPDQRHRSMYRELLFLAIRALDSENIDRMAFDKVYKPAFQSLRKDEGFISILQADDRPPSVTATWCRQAFRPLEV